VGTSASPDTSGAIAQARDEQPGEMGASDGSGAPSPDYLADETRGPGIIASGVIMAFIATVFVGLRFYKRMFIVRKLWLADWIILFALVFSIGNTAGGIRRKSSLLLPPRSVLTMPLKRSRYARQADTSGHWRQTQLAHG
jgi:hypothetical protein